MATKTINVDMLAKMFLAGAQNIEARKEYINELNRQYKVFKYFVTEDGDLCLDSCIPSSSDSFDGELVYTIIDVLLKHLVEHYAVLMRKIWSENN